MMSSFLCFVCHSTVNADTSEETREKYREVIGMNLCPDSHLCHICCYLINKMWMFKSICLKRSLEYPVLFSEKGTLNLQRSETSVAIMCPEDICIQHLNTKYHFYNHNENSQSDFDENNYCELEDERNFEVNDGFLKHGPFDNLSNEEFLFVTKDNVEDNLFNEDLILPTLELPVKVTQNDLVNGEWTENIPQTDNTNNKLNIDLVPNENCRVDLVKKIDSYSIDPINKINNYRIDPINKINNYRIDPTGTDKSYAIDSANTGNNCRIDPVNTGNNCRIDPVNTGNNCRIDPVNKDGNYKIDQVNTNSNFPIDPVSTNTNSNCTIDPVSTNSNCTIDPVSTNSNCTIDPVNTNNSYKIDPTPLPPANCRKEITIDGLIVPVPIDEQSVPVTVDKNKIPVVIAIEGNEVPIIDTETPNFEEVMMVNNICFNPETNVYEQIESTIDEETAHDIKETIGINLDDNIDTNIGEDIFNSIINDNITTDINESITNIININEILGTDNKSTEADNASSEEIELPDADDSSTKPKKDFYYDRIELTSEQQKMELEKARKDQKYISSSFKCHSCAIPFYFKDTYVTHMMRHEESNGEHSCRICSLRFASTAVLRKHALNHRVRFRCTRCSEVVRERQRVTHARACMGVENSVKCHLCGQDFPSTSGVRQHIQRFHKTDKSSKNYLCNVCGKSFNTRSKVTTHMLSHADTKFDCDQCKSTFSSPYYLNQHKKLKHTPAEPELHHCETCNVSYNSRKSLMAHLRNTLAHKETGHKCSQCDRVCPTRIALDEHTASVHARTRHLVCDVCPHRRYSTKRAYLRHMEKHKEGKPVPLCHACGARFRCVNVLKKHLLNVCEKNRKLREQEEETERKRRQQEQLKQQQEQLQQKQLQQQPFVHNIAV